MQPWEALPREALDVLAPRMPALVDEIIAAIGVEVPAYARPLEGGFGMAVRLGVEQALAQFDEMARNPGVGRALGREIYVGLGRGEVREGRSLEALLAAYRVGARVAWRRLAEAGVEAGFEPETLVTLAEAIFAYIDELSAESAEGFAREQAERAGETDRLRTVLVELLVRTPPAAPESVAAAAEAARWRPPRAVAAIAWSAQRDRRPVGRLPHGSIAAPLDGLMCALVPDPAAPGRRAEIEAALRGTAAGLGPAVAPGEAAASWHRATAALELATGEPRLLAADEHRAELLLRSDPSLVGEIARDRLAPLANETPASRERLRTTLLAWLRNAGNIPAAAGELHVHPQTVRYRLGRLRELYGETLDDPDSRFELELALRSAATQLSRHP